MASTSVNADSMTNAQGEFKPSVPRDEPLQTKGHQVGQLVGNDAAPEFNAQVLPAGSAPKESTYQPNPINEVPGQANNPDANAVKADPLDFPGATSGDVHQGIGKPEAQGTAKELGTNSADKSKDAKPETKDVGVTGGSGLTGDKNAEAKKLQEEHTDTGPAAARENNASITGAEGKEPEHAT